jgi:hypothetical protein
MCKARQQQGGTPAPPHVYSQSASTARWRVRSLRVPGPSAISPFHVSSFRPTAWAATALASGAVARRVQLRRRQHRRVGVLLEDALDAVRLDCPPPQGKVASAAAQGPVFAVHGHPHSTATAYSNNPPLSPTRTRGLGSRMRRITIQAPTTAGRNARTTTYTLTLGLNRAVEGAEPPHARPQRPQPLPRLQLQAQRLGSHCPRQRGRILVARSVHRPPLNQRVGVLLEDAVDAVRLDCPPPQGKVASAAAQGPVFAVHGHPH